MKCNNVGLFRRMEWSRESQVLILLFMEIHEIGIFYLSAIGMSCSLKNLGESGDKMMRVSSSWKAQSES